MFKISLIAVLIAGAAVSTANAAEVNGYLFGNIGRAEADAGRVNNALDLVADEIATEFNLEGGSSFDDKDTGYKIGAGIQLNRYVGIEFQYVDLGAITYEAAGTGNGIVEAGTLKADASTKGLGINAVGSLPFDRFTLFGKVGYHKLETEAEIKETYVVTDVGTVSFKETDSAKEWVTSYGVGASFAFTPTVVLVGELERYRDVADEYDIDLASVGLRYNF